MAPAAGGAVEGQFDGRRFQYGKVTTTFFQRDGGPWVRTDDSDGQLRDFPVKFTFGVFPLQQYLIETRNGRLQALSIAWDARPATAGGQRWFHLYPGEHVDHGDPLHWTGREQNWNFMCADCHSTNVRKNYDSATDSFRTTWSAIDVECESCHGPGSQHLAWAEDASRGQAGRWTSNGLTVQLTERQQVRWTVDPSTLQPVRSTPRRTSREIETCAVCHSRRAQIADGYTAGAVFGDFYEPVTLDASLYYPDGQQQDEVYTYGSFQESRMANAGVTCSDCHDPHSGAVRAKGNALCTECHQAARYDTSAHHHHAAAGKGSACVDCHMPARTYMQIDDRRDHSLRIPRPDLTATTGAPNACNGCHTTRTPEWAAAAVRAWYGHDPSGFQDFAQAFHDVDARRPNSDAAVARIAASPAEPAIVRASALERLTTSAAASSAGAALGDPDPLVRRAALDALEVVPPADRLAAVPLLADPVRSVRIAAASLLAPASGQLSGESRSAFDRAAGDLVAAEHFNADRPERRVALGVFLTDVGQFDQAADEYRAAIRLGPDFVPGYVDLAELQRTRGDEPSAERTLRMGLARLPADADLHYALGLSLTRSHRSNDALAEFTRATALAPRNLRLTYAHALALNGAGRRDEAIRMLDTALSAHPDDVEVLLALASMERDARRLDAARRHAARLVDLDPGNPDARALLNELRPQ